LLDMILSRDVNELKYNCKCTIRDGIYLILS